MQSKSHRIIVSQTIRPQDDFYHYVCSDWLKKNPRPDNQSCWGHFSALATEVDGQIEQILADWLKSGAKLTASQKQAVELYRVYLFKDRLAPAGATSLLDTYRQLIKPLTEENLAASLARLTRVGLGVFWDFSIDTNNQDPQGFILSLDQPDLSPAGPQLLSRSGSTLPGLSSGLPALYPPVLASGTARTAAPGRQQPDWPPPADQAA